MFDWTGRIVKIIDEKGFKLVPGKWKLLEDGAASLAFTYCGPRGIPEKLLLQRIY